MILESMDGNGSEEKTATLRQLIEKTPPTKCTRERGLRSQLRSVSTEETLGRTCNKHPGAIP